MPLLHMQTFLKQNLKKILLSIPAVIALLFILGNLKRDNIVFSNCLITSYNDSSHKGTSKIQDLKLLDKNKLLFSYTLGSGFQYPYLGIQLNNPSKPTFDISEFDYIEIDLQAENSKSIPIIINLEYPESVIGQDTIRQRPVWNDLYYKKDQNVYRLPLVDFRTPPWWFINTKKTTNEIAPPDYQHTTGVTIQNCPLLPVNQNESVIINSIRFGKNCFKGTTTVLAILSFFYLMVFFIVKLKQGQFPLYKNRDVYHLEDEDTRNIINYISENYNNADLCMDMLQRELGMSETTISSIFKKASGTTFKKYLNQVRINEAKRLLEQTDKQIMDVAYSVGYGNASHFNKVFKSSEGCAPNEYRKIMKKSPNPGA